MIKNRFFQTQMKTIHGRINLLKYKFAIKVYDYLANYLSKEVKNTLNKIPLDPPEFLLQDGKLIENPKSMAHILKNDSIFGSAKVTSEK